MRVTREPAPARLAVLGGGVVDSPGGVVARHADGAVGGGGEAELSAAGAGGVGAGAGSHWCGGRGKSGTHRSKK